MSTIHKLFITQKEGEFSQRKRKLVLGIWGGIFVLLLLTMLVYTSLQKEWGIFAIFMGIVFFVALSVAYLYSSFFSPLYQELLSCLEKVGICPDSELDASFTLKKLLSFLEQKLEELSNEKKAVEKELTQKLEELSNEKKAVEKELTQKLEDIQVNEKELSQKLKTLFHYLPLGILFINQQGTIQPNFTHYLSSKISSEAIVGQKIQDIFFNHCDVQKKKKLEQWLEKFTNSPLVLSIPFAFQDNLLSLLEFTFVPLEASSEILVFLVDITEEHRLREALARAEEKNASLLEAIREILQADPALVKNFLEESVQYSKSFMEKLEHLSEKPFKRAVIQEIFQELQEIWSNIRLVKFKTLEKEIGKIETLLEIVRNAPSPRQEQLQEIQERSHLFLDMFLQYIHLAKKVIEKPFFPIPPKEPSCSDNIRFLLVAKKFPYLVHAGLSGTSSLAEIVRYIRQLQEHIEYLGRQERLEHTVFDFLDILHRTLDSLRINVQQRQLKLELQHSPSHILLYGDCLKMVELLAMVMHASLLRAEITSALKIHYNIIPQENKPDILEIETRVTIRNTTLKTLQMVKQWHYKLGERYSKECGGELNSHKWGFYLKLPLVVDKYFAPVLKIAFVGHIQESFHKNLEEVVQYFPFSIEMFHSPADYEGYSIVMAEAKALQTFSSHIQNKREQLSYHIPLVALVSHEEIELQNQMFQYGADECLKIPTTISDLRWCILFCLSRLIKCKLKR